MKSLVEGIQTGLILCFLIGPIFFTLIRTGIERGFRAGVAVGLGIWMSDSMLILAFYSSVSYVMQLLAWEGFSFYIGIVGSIILALFGVSALMSKPVAFGQPSDDLNVKPSSSYVSLWFTGFIINTINPFNILFWFGLMSTALLKQDWAARHVSLYFGGIIGTVIITDLVKVLLAKSIRRIMTAQHLVWMRRISGVALIVFGIALFVRTIIFQA